MNDFSRYHHQSPAFAGYDTDDQREWVLALPNDRLAWHTREHLPDDLIAQLARAYFSTTDGPHLDALLEDTREAYTKACRLNGEL